MLNANSIHTPFVWFIDIIGDGPAWGIDRRPVPHHRRSVTGSRSSDPAARRTRTSAATKPTLSWLPDLSSTSATRRAAAAPAINVRSREAAEFAEQLVKFSQTANQLVELLRGESVRNPAVRAKMSDAYRVAADARSLIAQCDGLSSLDPIVPAYSRLDAEWRRLSFDLRSLTGLSAQCIGAIDQGDQAAASMGRMLNLQPQLDRHALHDLMIVVATQMDTLIDDLAIVRVPAQTAQRLTRDVRVIRGQMMREADQVEFSTQESIVSLFTDFVGRWSPIADAISGLNDPHLSRRLDRIGEGSDQISAMLWIPPPQNAQSLAASAHRLEQALGELLDQLTIRLLANLDPREQSMALERSRRMFQQARQLEESAESGASRDAMAAALVPIDQDWNELRAVYSKLPRLNPASLASVHREIGLLRNALGVAGGIGYFDPASLAQAAASLEGSSEYFRADARRYERYLQPAAFRQSFIGSADEVFQHARSLHVLLDGREPLEAVEREAEHLLDAWQSLSQNVNQIEQRGLSGSRSASLKRAHAEMAPMIAEIAATLLGR